MNLELVLVLGLLVLAIVLFSIGRPRTDVVALLMVATLPFTGVIDIGEAIAGFSDPSIVLIALLFVIGEGLVRTGVAQRLSELIIRVAGGNETVLLVALMLAVGAIGSVMSSTGVVAIFIPIVLRIARSSRIAPGRLMMPLSVAALCSGMMTLVATAPNLVVHGELLREGYGGFAFLDFLPFGVPVLALSVLYMLFARRWLPGAASAMVSGAPRLEDWITEYRLDGRAFRVRIAADSPLAGQVASTLEGGALAGMNVLAVEQSGRFGMRMLASPLGMRMDPGDALLLDVHDAGVDAQARFSELRLEPLPLEGAYFSGYANDIGMAEMMVAANSPLAGNSASRARLHERHDLALIGLKHGRTAEVLGLAEEKLEVGDTLLVAGPWPAIRALGSGPDGLILLNLPLEAEEVAPSAARAPFALACLLLTVGLMVSGIVPNVHAALIGCLLMGLTGCVDLRSAYRSIHWPSLVLIVGMLPFSLALQRTGGVDLAADLLLDSVGEAGPRVVLAAIFVVTAVFGMFISNTAIAVLMAPVALAVAQHLGLSPYPFAMTVALAASTAFMTPVSSPVNALVVGPGGYRFVDFVKVGTPLAVLTLLLVVLLVPWVFGM
ncbi:SLC13 family permease [Pseudoxanthomonas daejeonensis]|uniref:SLC13 family permease n=1 Tax=Pseudoxanthomonas daejeonensis TaxID=266062 RepID=A0ABQ6Z9D7_9GAMM|nr:SLC13 family permease [Pseudoxanthomonas daejeonensis]KAF1695936.1 SLC13 family permease [Pseudoxanthomonas daejeonensis]UNK57627.1 SLC13 family permease [Pseudoxanthomonas daejeonensis]